MGKQSAAFLNGEGEAWGKRNYHKARPDPDPVIEAIAKLDPKPTRILEVGCGDGQRLGYLTGQYNLTACCGVDPAANDHSIIYRGTAENLDMFPEGSFDLVIYGFCLYLCDPTDYFLIASEGDHVLADGGHIIIHDFYTVEERFKVPYKHKEGIFSHHFNFTKLWLWHPHYRLVTGYHNSNDEQLITVLRKYTKHAFPVRPE